MSLPSPLEFGWEMKNGMFDIKWFEGEQYPKDIDITANKAVADEENNEYDVDQQFVWDGNESTDDDEDEDYYNHFIY